MKKIYRYALASYLCFMAFACDNAFINETPDVADMTNVTFLISPDWGTCNYTIFGTGNNYKSQYNNAEYRIVRTPEWLTVQNMSGRFDGAATTTLHCNAYHHDAFSETGVYNDFLTIDVDGVGKCVVPIAYVKEGAPIATVDKSTVEFDYSMLWQPALCNIINNSNGILVWNIKDKPTWIDVIVEGSYSYTYAPFLIDKNSRTTLNIRSLSSSLPDEETTDKIVIETNDPNNREIIIDVKMNLGNPRLECNNAQLDFGRTETRLTFNFSNTGNGLLKWELDGSSDWLIASKSSGQISSYGWETIEFTCVRGLLPDGLQQQTFYIKSNDKANPKQAITVSAYGHKSNAENVVPVYGNITDVWMDKALDRLYITTSQPNRLLSYNLQSRAIDRELTLDKAPNCFSVNESGSRALVGHGGMISCVDMNSFSVFKKFDVDINVFDIEWGEGDWCCYTPGTGASSWLTLHWRNISTDEKHYSDEEYLSERTLVKRVPDNKFVIASRLFSSPSGIIVYNRNTQTRQYYYHEDIGDFWFDNSGEYFFTSHNKIYRTSSLWTEVNPYPIDPYPIGEFKNAPNRIYGLDQNATTKNLWIMTSAPNDFYGTQREIYRYERNDYTRTGAYYYEEYYTPPSDAALPAIQYSVQPHYIFTNRLETELVVVRNISSNYAPQYGWSIEHIALHE